MQNYTLADMVSRLRVASKQRLVSIKVIKTKQCFEVLNKLYEIGFIRGFYVFKNEDIILVYLKYYKNRACFYNIELISTPGRKIYWRLNCMANKYTCKGFLGAGHYIVSTPQGLKTSAECLLGHFTSGEILLKVSV